MQEGGTQGERRLKGVAQIVHKPLIFLSKSKTLQLLPLVVLTHSYNALPNNKSPCTELAHRTPWSQLPH